MNVRWQRPAIGLGIGLGLSAQMGALIGLAPVVHAVSWTPDLLAPTVTMHVAGSLIVAESLARAVPEDGRRSARFLLIITALFGSVLGALGIWAVLAAVGRARTREAGPEPTRGVPEPGFPARTDLSLAPSRSRGSLLGRLRYAGDPAARLRAVMAARRIAGPGAVPLLKLALRDPVEDVRLLGYAILEGRQGAIYRAIQDATRALESASERARPGLHLELAQQYWELVYQGLVDGDLETYVLAKAKLHLERAIELEPDNPTLRFLLGRVRLRQRDYAEAAENLGQARALGLPARVVSPHEAEVAFAERRFSEVRRLLRGLGQARSRRPILFRLIEYWQ